MKTIAYYLEQEGKDYPVELPALDDMSKHQLTDEWEKTHQIETALAAIGLEKQLLLPLLYLYKTHIGTMTQQNSFFIEVQHFINILS